MIKELKINVRRIWQCSLVVAVLMFIIGIATDSRDVERYASRMERLMVKGDYEEALKVGDRADASDHKLMLLRMQALNHEGLLGEKLFTYPIVCQGKEFANLGGDYALCACLIDKDLDAFVRLLPKYYKVNDKLPCHYREALIHYKHIRSNPLIVFSDAVLDTDYRDMQALADKYADPQERQMALFDMYKGTYWYYYAY